MLYVVVHFLILSMERQKQVDLQDQPSLHSEFRPARAT